MFGAHMSHAAYNHNPIQGVKKPLPDISQIAFKSMAIIRYCAGFSLACLARIALAWASSLAASALSPILRRRLA